VIVRISGLRVRGRHGVLPVERERGQVFVADVALTVADETSAATDALADTVDYAALSERLRDVMAGEPVDLIETLAGRLADVCLADERVASVEVTVHKPEVPLRVDVDEVSVTLARSRP
jgi:dihydroneopterin aldolase